MLNLLLEAENAAKAGFVALKEINYYDCCVAQGFQGNQLNDERLSSCMLNVQDDDEIGGGRLGGGRLCLHPALSEFLWLLLSVSWPRKIREFVSAPTQTIRDELVS